MRKSWRRALRCPCDPEALQPGILTDAKSERVRAYLRACESVLPSEEQHTCLWWHYYDPRVAAVIRAWRWYEKGQLSTWLGPNPERWLIDGVSHYATAFEICKADALKVRRE